MEKERGRGMDGGRDGLGREGVRLFLLLMMMMSCERCSFFFNYY